MNSLTRIMSYDNIKVENVKSENQITKIPKLSEEEIEKIIFEKYSDKDKKTKSFIKKALKIHGDKYDYSNAIYVKNDEKVEIICKIKGHELFLQTPHNHLKNHGCPSCSGNKKLTIEKFIERANEVHGLGTYDYSKVKYKSYHKDVTIICQKHGKFSQTPANHLNGHGCLICSHDYVGECKKLTLKEFIQKANEVHGLGTYDYSKVKYVNYDIEVIIICLKHGDFPQTPDAHSQGEGCPKCNNYKGEIAIRKFLTKNKIEFVEQKKFDDCKDNRCLPFDFYLPQYNLCIEFDGIQHFKPHAFHSKNVTEEEKLKNLKYVQHHAQIKNEYCKKNRIILLRLNDYNTVDKELTEYFLNYKI